MMAEKKRHIHVCLFALIMLLPGLTLPLTLRGQEPPPSVPWEEIQLTGASRKVHSVPAPDGTRAEASRPPPEIEVSFGLGAKSASFDEQTGWIVDSIITWFYSQPQQLERLFTEMQAEIGFLDEPVAYQRRATYHAEAGWSHWLNPSLKAGARASFGLSTLEGSTAMLYVPFDSQDFAPQPLSGHLSGNITHFALGAEATWYASGVGRSWRPLAGLTGGWNHFRWTNTRLEVSGVPFELPEPEAINPLHAGMHAGVRKTLKGVPHGSGAALEARFFYKHFFTEKNASITGFNASVMIPLQ